MRTAFSTILLAVVAFAGRALAQPLGLTHTYANPTPAAGDMFGHSVAGSGDKALVGAPEDDTGAPEAGAAYLFDATTGALLLTFNNPFPDEGDQFGFAVAMVGNNVLIGAPFKDASAGTIIDAGAAYLFDGTTGLLLHTFVDPAPDNDELFGIALASLGNNVLIGSPFDDTGAIDAGAAYLFNGSSGALLHTFANPTPASGDEFGIAIAGVGSNNVLVGAPSDDAGASNSGAAHLFNGSTGALIFTIPNPTPAASDAFGNAVAGSGNDPIVAARSDNTGATDAGAVYRFNGTTGALLQTLLNPAAAGGDQFGSAVAGVGSSGLVLVGTHLDDTPLSNTGTAYLFDASGALAQTFSNPAAAIGDNFSFAVAGVGNKVLIGTPNDDASGTNSGIAYLYASPNQPPITNAGADQTLECTSPSGSAVTLDGSASSDPDNDLLTYTWREGANIIAGPTTSPTSVVTFDLGTHTIELTVDDGNGETDTDVVLIIVADTTPPIITLNGANPMTLECNAPYNEPGAVVSDACDPSPSLVITGTVNPNVSGVYLITYTATDERDNNSSTTRTVNVVTDVTPPTITLSGENPMTVECHDPYTEPGAEVSDACDPSPSLVITGTVNSDAPGTFLITYTATDASGNNTSMTRTVEVIDTVPPIVTLQPAIVLWPPNHKYITISMSQCVTNVSDACAGSIPLSAVKIASVSSDEPEDAPDGQCNITDPLHVCFNGDGSTTIDIEIASDCQSVKLRSERAASSNGRVYTLNLEVSDASGNVATAAFNVSVPHDQGGGSVAVDNGPYYTIASSCGSVSAPKVAAGDGEDRAAEATVPGLPQGYALLQNYPNPFNPETEIRFHLLDGSHVMVRIFSTLGTEIRTLADGSFTAGFHSLRWDGKNHHGEKVQSGMYFYRLVTPKFSATRKMILAE